jgi:hypothetical protein
LATAAADPDGCTPFHEPGNREMGTAARDVYTETKTVYLRARAGRA